MSCKGRERLARIIKTVLMTKIAFPLAEVLVLRFLELVAQTDDRKYFVTPGWVMISRTLPGLANSGCIYSFGDVHLSRLDGVKVVVRRVPDSESHIRLHEQTGRKGWHQAWQVKHDGTNKPGGLISATETTKIVTTASTVQNSRPHWSDYGDFER